MTMKTAEQGHGASVPPVLDLSNLPSDLKAAVKVGPLGDGDIAPVVFLRAQSEPWKARGETSEQTSAALSQLKPFVHVAKLQNQVVGYVTVERDGPVPGAAYMRNVVVKSELRRRGVGSLLLGHAVQVAKDMYRKTLALRVDPSNAPAVSFYRHSGFTTVATVVSKKSGKLRLLMSREL
jgi:[ribosomal protein S18]-alanine N-acetyltransferase